MSTYLVFSPHLDDAVLSCGAQIAQWTAEGHTVYVATIFNRSNEARVQHYARRLEDDEAAIRQLGATAIYLNFPDAPFRDAAYCRFSTIVQRENLPAEAREVAAALGPILQMVAEDAGAEAVYFPLAIGGHVDHLAVFEASKIFWDTALPVAYYEDQPYALVPGWRTVRWLQHGAALQTALPAPATAPARLQDLPLAFIANYMADEADLQASEALHAAQQAVLLPAMAGACGWSIGSRRFSLHSAAFPISGFRQKIAAISCYTSEWPVLFGPSEANILQTLGQPDNAHGYTEIYWTLNR
ncbi:MAG TPA: PIG-L family deacetylase [Chitinophaga sp.]